MHLPALRLEKPPIMIDNEFNDLSSEDEAVANDLDMHALILSGFHTVRKIFIFFSKKNYFKLIFF